MKWMPHGGNVLCAAFCVKQMRSLIWRKGEKSPWTFSPESVEFPPRMKSNPLRTFFEWALITSVLMSVLFLAWYIVKSRQARAYNVQIARAQVRLQYNRSVMAMLAAECQAYARTNADMQRLLAPTASVPAPTAPAKGSK